MLNQITGYFGRNTSLTLSLEDRYVHYDKFYCVFLVTMYHVRALIQIWTEKLYTVNVCILVQDKLLQLNHAA